MSDEEWTAKFNEAGLQDWRVRQSVARAEFSCGSFTAAGECAAKAAAICDEQNHHAELDVRHPDLLQVSTWSHDVGGLTDRDLELAKAISAAVDG